MKTLLNFSFWFDTKDAINVNFTRILLVVALSLIILSFIYLTLMALLYKNSKAYAILRENIFYSLFISGLALFLAWFFRYEQLVYLGARITLLVVGLIILGWVIYLIPVIKKVFLPMLHEEKDWHRKEKYLPKAHKTKLSR